MTQQNEQIELKDSERQKCEVWTRVMGYHRPVQSFNIGKKGEFDFPGKLSAVAFLQGCPWRCVYCQNPWMQPAEFSPELEHDSWEKLESLLMRRKGLLDGVVFSGGEPTVDPALPDAVRRVKDMGFAVGLHTGGIIPKRLGEILPLIDWMRNSMTG